MPKYLLLLLLSGCAQFLFSQSKAVEKIRADHQSRHRDLLKEYMDFLAIPNTMNDPAQLQANAEYVAGMMKKRGIQNVRLLHADTEGAIPAVYGEVLTPGATRTLIFYAHYDGQPVNPDKWAEGLSPFKPQLAGAPLDKGGQFVDFPAPGAAINPDWRLYARAAADDKAGVFTILNAYDAIRRTGLTPKINIKFFFEGEEEKGSTNLGEILDKYKSLLQAEAWIICDGPMHASGKKQITFGVRGDVNMNLTVFGAKRPLHSGNYGNWAPNPAMKLVRLLATMKDDNGRVLIDGFYDDVAPLSASERAALAAIPDPAPMMQQELAFAQSENPALTFLEAITTQPTLNINGIVSANVGRLASNIIPTMATVTLDLRLVKGNDYQRQIQKVIDHVKKQGYYVLDREPTDEERLQYANIATVRSGTGYNAQRTSMDLPISRQVIQAVKSTTPQDVILMPSAGGSLPLYLFEEKLNTPPISVPVVNYDNNQHGENENVRIGCLWEGIETIAAIMLID
ncbi:MAG: M20/M25/M40 family metallo-hydrolase [Saprospiraceae bacterium]|nr:M20/M25/M40 family metallo-hydrolase [Saprospiraceae bacterium]